MSENVLIFNLYFILLRKTDIDKQMNIYKD